MSDEFDPISDNSFSTFWPLLILVVGLLIWFAVQDYELNGQRSAYSKQFQTVLPTVNEAQNIGSRYVSVMKDLVQTAQKDPAAAQIVKEAIQANMIHVQPNGTNSAANPAAPAPTPAK